MWRWRLVCWLFGHRWVFGARRDQVVFICRVCGKRGEP